MKKYTIDDHFLGRWADNNLTEEELDFFKNSPDFELYEKIYSKAEFFKPVSFDTTQKFTDLKNKLQDQQENKVISIFKKTSFLISGIAASLLLVIGFFFYNSTSDVIVKTEIAEKTEINLPDGSIVNLNANSILSYNKEDFSKNRNLNLKGEAFFKVSKGSKFTVTTSQGTVKVLGTQFNVITRNKLFETICYEGKVQVNSDDTQKILNPTNGIRFYDGTSTELKVNTKKPNWISNLSYFNKVSLKVVIDELQNQYKININSKKVNTSQIITTHFTHNNLKEALETVCAPLKINYTFADDSNVILE